MRKMIEIDTGDKTRHLKYGMNALIQLEKEMGKPLSQLGTESDVKLEDLRTMLYVGLLHEDRNLTHEQVGDFMDYMMESKEQTYLSEKLQEAMSYGSSAMPSKA